MSPTGSLHKVTTKVSLLATAVLSGLLAFSDLPALTSRTAVPGVGSNRSVVEARDEVNGAIVLAIALAGSAAIGVGLTAAVERDRSPAASYPSLLKPTPSQSTPLSFAQVSRPLQRKLLRLLHNDYGAAHRLFVHASLKYPGKAPDWYAEKILYDLARDRGKY